MPWPSPGSCCSRKRPTAKLYRLNRDHVAAAGIVALAQQWDTLAQQIRGEPGALVATSEGGSAGFESRRGYNTKPSSAGGFVVSRGVRMTPHSSPRVHTTRTHPKEPGGLLRPVAAHLRRAGQRTGVRRDRASSLCSCAPASAGPPVTSAREAMARLAAVCRIAQQVDTPLRDRGGSDTLLMLTVDTSS